jgi:hypothetical protein
MSNTTFRRHFTDVAKEVSATRSAPVVMITCFCAITRARPADRRTSALTVNGQLQILLSTDHESTPEGKRNHAFYRHSGSSPMRKSRCQRSACQGFADSSSSSTQAEQAGGHELVLGSAREPVGDLTNVTRLPLHALQPRLDCLTTIIGNQSVTMLVTENFT